MSDEFPGSVIWQRSSEILGGAVDISPAAGAENAGNYRLVQACTRTHTADATSRPRSVGADTWKVSTRSLLVRTRGRCSMSAVHASSRPSLSSVRRCPHPRRATSPALSGTTRSKRATAAQSSGTRASHCGGHHAVKCRADTGCRRISPPPAQPSPRMHVDGICMLPHGPCLPMPTAAITSVTHIIHPALFHMRARSFTRLTFSLSAQRAAFAAGPRSYFPASFASDDLYSEFQIQSTFRGRRRQRSPRRAHARFYYLFGRTTVLTT